MKRQVTDAQESHAKHVSEINAQMDAKEKNIQADVDGRATADHAALSSLELRAQRALGFFYREKLKAPL